MSNAIKVSASTILWNHQLRHLLMLKRGPTAKFMPNTYVFPGGLAESSSDFSFPVDLTNYTSVDNTKIIPKGLSSDLPLRICSLRETFEETGLLFVSDKANSQKEVLSTLKDDSLKKMQEKIKNKPSLFKDLFKDFIADVGALIPWAMWRTPTSYPTRYTTVFYVLNVDEDYKIDLCEKEMQNYFWKKPSDIIEGASGKIILPPPQYYEIMRIRLAGDMDLSLMTDPTLICPQVYKTIDEPKKIVTIMPGDNMYIKNMEESLKVTNNEISWKDLNMDDNKKTMHRLIYDTKPIYANVELLIKNIKESNKKSLHLFYYAPKNKWA
uniref:Nudix hydrolase domain-containing protein n=1 Tax=Parastrongyloides trichosuri TaxID=131310 RepID=A0A0N4ZX02_PARTI